MRFRHRAKLEVELAHIRSDERSQESTRVSRVEVGELEVTELEEGYRAIGEVPGRAGDARTGVVEGETLEAGGLAEDVEPAVKGNADVVGVDAELELCEVAEEGGGGGGPLDVDADEGEAAEEGEGAVEDDDGGRADVTPETVGVLPVFDVVEVERAELGPGADGGEDGAGMALAGEVADAQDERAPAVDVGLEGVKSREELVAEDMVAADVVGLGGRVEEDVEGEAGGAGDVGEGAGDVTDLGEGDVGP